jgi:hypothetical protein
VGRGDRILRRLPADRARAPGSGTRPGSRAGSRPAQRALRGARGPARGRTWGGRGGACISAFQRERPRSKTPPSGLRPLACGLLPTPPPGTPPAPGSPLPFPCPWCHSGPQRRLFSWSDRVACQKSRIRRPPGEQGLSLGLESRLLGSSQAQGYLSGDGRKGEGCAPVVGCALPHTPRRCRRPPGRDLSRGQFSSVFVDMIVVKFWNTIQSGEKQDLESAEKVDGGWRSCLSPQ